VARGRGGGQFLLARGGVQLCYTRDIQEIPVHKVSMFIEVYVNVHMALKIHIWERNSLKLNYIYMFIERHIHIHYSQLRRIHTHDPNDEVLKDVDA